MQAIDGIEELRKYVDTILVICNDKLLDMQGDMKLSQAFGKADNVLTIAAKGIAEIITVTGRINVDFEDVKTVMQNSGKAIMGAGIASGPDRAVHAVEMALNSPLLDDTDIKGASNVLLYITSGRNEISLEELNAITSYITSRTGEDANVIWGDGIDENLEDEISVTLIATGFNKPVRTIHTLDSVQNTMITPPQPVTVECINEIHFVEPVNHIKTFEEAAKQVPSQTENNIPVTLSDESAAQKTEPVSEKSLQVPEPFEIRSFFRPEPELEIVMPVMNHQTLTPESVKTPQDTRSVEQEDVRQDRVSKLKSLSHKPAVTSSVEEMERVPAYMRRNVDLPEPGKIHENQVSRLTLDSDTDSRTTLRGNNTFLHDNVD
jgi:cell division protein FtsZ